MSKRAYLITVAAVMAVLMCSTALAQTDSIWIESEMADPGGSYSVSMHGRFYQDIGSLEIPLISSSDDLVFDTVTGEGSMIPPDMMIGAILKNDGNKVLINFVPGYSLAPIEPAEGKLCEIYFHIKPSAPGQTIIMDTITDTVFISPDSSFIVTTWLRGWAPDGITQIPLAFGSGMVEVQDYPICGDANFDDNVDVSDVIYIINYIFMGGDVPANYYSGDTNSDGEVTFLDIIQLVNYIFRGGPGPCVPY